MQQDRSEFWELMKVVAAYAAGLVVVLAVDYAFNRSITGRGMFGSILVAALCALWVGYRRRWKEKQRLQDERLKRRAIFYKNGNDQRGEVSGSGLAILAALVGLALIFASVQFCIGAEPEEPELIDVALVSITEQLWPAVPMKSQELYELQYLTMKVGLLHKATEDTPPSMPGPVSEKRAAIRRTLKKLHLDMIELQVLQAGETLRATRKGGAK